MLKKKKKIPLVCRRPRKHQCDGRRRLTKPLFVGDLERILCKLLVKKCLIFHLFRFPLTADTNAAVHPSPEENTFFIYLVRYGLFMRRGPSCCWVFWCHLPTMHLFQPQRQERVKRVRLHNFRKPSIFALLCGLAVFIQPGASCCVLGSFLFAILLAVCCASWAAEFVHVPGGPSLLLLQHQRGGDSFFFLHWFVESGRVKAKPSSCSSSFTHSQNTAISTTPDWLPVCCHIALVQGAYAAR